MAESWRGWLSAWDGFRTKADEFRELDAERVLVFAQRSAARAARRADWRLPSRSQRGVLESARRAILRL